MKTTKRLTEAQIYWILFISLAVCIPILIYAIKSVNTRQDVWLNKHDSEIQELTATVTNSIHHNGRSPYYEISLDVSNGAYLVYKLEKNLEGQVPIYCINIDGENYYGFSRGELYWEVYKFMNLVIIIGFAFLLCGPVGLFLYLREIYGYGIRMKKNGKLRQF